MIDENGSKKRNRNASISSGTYGLGLIGALVYYIQHATSFGDGVLGFLKALIWPAMLVYNLLEHLKM
ncbi:MAG: hypothetical protein ACHQM6_09435 [Candidatus Kapaibacterium sp.]